MDNGRRGRRVAAYRIMRQRMKEYKEQYRKEATAYWAYINGLGDDDLWEVWHPSNILDALAAWARNAIDVWAAECPPRSPSVCMKIRAFVRQGWDRTASFPCTPERDHRGYTTVPGCGLCPGHIV